MGKTDILLGVAIILFLLLAATAGTTDHSQQTCPDGNCPIESSWLQSLAVTSDAPRSSSYNVAMDLPLSMRQQNWGGGSCVHASNVSLLRWQGQYEMAEWWRKSYSGGEYSTRLINRMESAGLRYAYTDRADMEFLRWCVRTRRGAGIFYKPYHSINVVHMDEQYVYLLDNNYVDYPEQHGHYERVPVAEFEQRWRGFGGFSWTLVYQPPPPVPYL